MNEIEKTMLGEVTLCPVCDTFHPITETCDEIKAMGEEQIKKFCQGTDCICYQTTQRLTDMFKTGDVVHLKDGDCLHRKNKQ